MGTFIGEEPFKTNVLLSHLSLYHTYHPLSTLIVLYRTLSWTYLLVNRNYKKCEFPIISMLRHAVCNMLNDMGDLLSRGNLVADMVV